VVPEPVSTRPPEADRDRLAGQHLNALLAVVVRDEGREPRGEEAKADPRLGEEHRDAAAGPDEAGSELGADEAAPDHHDVGALSSDLAHAAVVVEGAVPDDPLRAGNLPRPGAGGEQQLLPRVLFSGVARRGACFEVEGDDPATGDELDALSRLAPELLLRRSLPQPLREQRSLVRRGRIGDGSS